MKRAVVVLLVVSSGCVTQGTYDALKKQQDEAQQELKARDATLADQQKQLASQKQQLDALDQDKKALQAQLADAQKQQDALKKQTEDLQQQIAETLKDRSSLRGSVAEMKVALADLQKRKAEAEARIAEYKDLLSRFQSMIDAGKLKVKLADGKMVVELATDVLFSSGSANLSKAGKQEIAEVAGLLASIPNRSFQVEGYTDNVPISTAQYPSNWELAAARALTVVKTMVDAGMPPERVSAASFGETRPATANDTPEGRAQNRRIEITVVPDLSSLPGFDELQRVTGAPATAPDGQAAQSGPK